MSSKRNTEIIVHIIAWAICISIPILIYYNPYGEVTSPFDEQFGIAEIINYTCFISFFYLNAFYLVPKLFSKKKIVTYIIIVVVLLAIVSTSNAYLSDYYHPHNPPRPFPRVFLYRIFISLANLALSTSYRMIMDNFMRERIQKEKEKENLLAELQFLRSQISPHFIFNVLNSVVSLVRKKSEQAEPVLIELSSLIRYMLYESDSDKVSMKSVETYMTSYVNLQKLRFGEDVKIDFEIIDNSKNENFIEPMLFIPLIENAFKHGIGIIDNPEIKVVLTVNDENANLFVSNKFSYSAKLDKEKKSGIGLHNLRRRLLLLYPENHKLELLANANEFNANLKINLK